MSKKGNFLKHFKGWVRSSAPPTFKARPYVRAWLAGEIDDALYLECNREWMEGEGMVKASGSWWPADIEERGAVVVDGVLYVRRIRRSVQDPEHPSRKLEVISPHPKWLAWMRELEMDDKAGVYADMVAKLPYKDEG